MSSGPEAGLSLRHAVFARKDPTFVKQLEAVLGVAGCCKGQLDSPFAAVESEVGQTLLSTAAIFSGSRDLGRE